MSGYETIGDVRADIDEAFASQGLRTIGGSFYPRIQSLAYGLVDAQGNRVGDARCVLPDGWQPSSYWPRYVGEPTGRSDGLRLKVMMGSGLLAVRDWGGQVRVDTGSDLQLKVRKGVSQQYHILNTGDELLVVHAMSTKYPSNMTDLNAVHTDYLDDNSSLVPDMTFRHEDVFNPDGTVTFTLAN